MTNDPDRIRADIEATRRELGGDVDALADKVNPGKAVGRQTDKVKNALGSVKDRVFGAADDTTSRLKDRAHGVSDSVGNLPHRAAETAQGNPLAVGLIAFGVGALVASLIPASSAEKQAASSVKDAAQPLLQEAQGAAKDLAQNMKEPAQEAAQSVKETATEGADHVKSEASGAASDLQSEADRARHAVQDGN